MMIKILSILASAIEGSIPSLPSALAVSESLKRETPLDLILPTFGEILTVYPKVELMNPT